MPFAVPTRKLLTTFEVPLFGHVLAQDTAHGVRYADYPTGVCEIHGKVDSQSPGAATARTMLGYRIGRVPGGVTSLSATADVDSSESTMLVGSVLLIPSGRSWTRTAVRFSVAVYDDRGSTLVRAYDGPDTVLYDQTCVLGILPRVDETKRSSVALNPMTVAEDEIVEVYVVLDQQVEAGGSFEYSAVNEATLDFVNLFYSYQ